MYLNNINQRSYLILKDIIERYPSVSGKDLQKKFSLSRKQLGYSIQKINDFLTINGFSEIKRLQDGGFIIPPDVEAAFHLEDMEVRGPAFIYSETERMQMIVLMLLCREEELSLQHFVSETGVSKNTLLADLKKLKDNLAKRDVNLVYNRKDGYTLAGSEYVKRILLIDSICKLLKTSHGVGMLTSLCKIQETFYRELLEDIELLEEKLQLQFTDDYLKEFSYILYFVLQRIRRGKLLTSLPEVYQHVQGTKEYSALLPFANKYGINNQMEKVFLTSQIQISKTHNRLMEQDSDKQNLQKAIDDMITNFEELNCVRFREREELSAILMQHCSPAFYRIKYNYHVETSIADLVLPQYGGLHQIVKKASEPFRRLLEREVPDDELVYITVMFGAWLSREGLWKNRKDRERALIVCTNGVTISNFLWVSLKELFPEFDFVGCMSVRNFQEHREDFDLVFSTIRLETEKPQFHVSPFLDGTNRQELREQVFSKLKKKRAWMTWELNRYIDRNQEARPAVLKEYYSLGDLLTEQTVRRIRDVLGWREAIEITAFPLLYRHQIEPSYVKRMITLIEENHPYLLVAEGVMIAHAGVDDGVHDVCMSMTVLPRRISVNGYMEADIILVLATPDVTRHLNALNQLIDLLDDKESLEKIRRLDRGEAIAAYISQFIKENCEQADREGEEEKC